MKVKYLGIIITLAIILTTVIFVLEFSKNDNRGELIVNFLDVGQGDAAFVTLPSYHRLLIDTGNQISLLSKLSTYLPFYDMSLDYLILTHPDLDHTGMYGELSHKFRIKNLVLSDISDFTSIMSFVKEETKVLNMKSTSSIIFRINESKNINIQNISVYKDFMTENSNSIVTKFEHQGFEFIFTGDIDAEVERLLVSQGYFNKKSHKILKVAHHGSKTSSSEYFLKNLDPEYCIISAGKNNIYNHPDEEVLGRLNKYCKNVFNTAMDGDIEFRIQDGELRIKTTK